MQRDAADTAAAGGDEEPPPRRVFGRRRRPAEAGPDSDRAKAERDSGPFESWMPPEPEREPPELEGEPPEPEREPPEPEREPPEPEREPPDAAVPGPEEPAVLAYCRALLPPPTAEEAAADVLTAWRDGATAADDDAGAEAGRDELLLAITRLMTAVSLPDRSSPAERRRAVRASIGAESRSSCRETGVLLAARANGNIDERQEYALDRHLAGCPGCRELVTRIRLAEQTYRAALATAVAEAAERLAAAEPALHDDDDLPTVPPPQPISMGNFGLSDVLPFASDPALRPADAERRHPGRDDPISHYALAIDPHDLPGALAEPDEPAPISEPAASPEGGGADDSGAATIHFVGRRKRRLPRPFGDN